MASYVFSGASLVERQLEGLSVTYDHVTIQRLSTIGIRPGWRCLEVGAGNGSIARAMADIVGASGRVVATDIDLDHLDSGDRSNLEVRRHDITADPLSDDEYDLVHARLVLFHLPQRHQVLKRFLRALKPGGWLLVEDYDVSGHRGAVAAPDSEADVLFEKITDGLSRVVTAAGADTGWGARAYAAVREAGFTHVTSEIYARTTPTGTPGFDLIATYTQQLRDPLLSTGLLTEAELDGFATLVSDPRFVLESPLFVSTWGQRPRPDT
jgi:ubiquinone/menaquinone biosynthesis C-methylase UbiE